MTSKRETYCRAIWNEWKWPVFSSARERLTKIAETLISAPFIFPVIGKIWNNSVAVDYILRGIISVVIGAIVVFVVHALIGLALAMRRVFYAKQDIVIALQSKTETHPVDHEPLFIDRSEQDARDVRLKAVKALTRAKQGLWSIVQCDYPQRPRGGPQNEHKREMEDFVRKMKRKASDILLICDRETAGIPEAQLGADGLDALDNCEQVVDYVKRKIEMIDSNLKIL